MKKLKTKEIKNIVGGKDCYCYFKHEYYVNQETSPLKCDYRSVNNFSECYEWCCNSSRGYGVWVPGSNKARC